MKILVAIKRVIDHNVKVRVKADGSGVELANVKMAINPFDEIAVEEAVRLKESGKASEVVVVSIGDISSQETLRSAMAMGADRAILVQRSTDMVFEPLDIARLLQQIVLTELPDLILLGKQAIDNDCNQTGQMLSALLKYSQATFASLIEVEEGSTLLVTREIDGGLETLSLPLPAVVTTDLRLNEPRYATLPNIMKAKKKPLEIHDISQMNFSPLGQVKILAVTEPKKRTGQCILFNDVNALVSELQAKEAI